MIAKKILLPAAAAALMTGPVLALPAQAPADPGNSHGPPSSHPNNADNPGSKHRSSKGTENSGGHHGMCKLHKVGYVASGVLLSDKLEKNADGTYSGEIEVKVTQTNHHGRVDKGTTRVYKAKELEHVHVTFGLADTNNDGSVGLDDLKPGETRVKLIGKISALKKKCNEKGFEAVRTIRQLVFNAPSQ
jgi:hypothetical protein